MSVRSALFFGTGSFVFIALPSYWTTLDPIHSLIYGMGVFFIMSLIGFQIGNILTHPKGSPGGLERFIRDLFTLAPPKTQNSTAIYETPAYHFQEAETFEPETFKGAAETLSDIEPESSNTPID